jgi:flagellar basal body rod protein FlgB
MNTPGFPQKPWVFQETLSRRAGKTALLELRHLISENRHVGAQKIKTMEASSDGMIDTRNHQVI